MKITPEYAEQNRRMHETGKYGISGKRWVSGVASLAQVFGSRDILDYGCGQRTLERELGWAIRNYDPCISCATHLNRGPFRSASKCPSSTGLSPRAK